MSTIRETNYLAARGCQVSAAQINNLNGKLPANFSEWNAWLHFHLLLTGSHVYTCYLVATFKTPDFYNSSNVIKVTTSNGTVPIAAR